MTIAVRTTPRREALNTTYHPAPLSPEAEAPVCFVRRAGEADALAALDDSYAGLTQAVEQRLTLYSRGLQVRIRRWLTKLDSVSTSNTTWKKNRNNYARLLLEQLRKGRLDKPFDAAPPAGPLPTLPKYLTYGFTPETGRQQARGRSGTPGRERSPATTRENEEGGSRRLSPKKADSEGVQSSPVQTSPVSSPRRGTGTRPKGVFLAGGRVVGGGEGGSPGAEGGRVSPSPRASSPPRVVDRFMGGLTPETQSQYIRKLEEQLGISRQRQLHLEAELARAQAQIDAQSAELTELRRLRVPPPSPPQHPPAAPKTGTSTPCVSGNNNNNKDCQRRVARENLDRMIQRVEATRQSWDSPGGNGSGSLVSRARMEAAKAALQEEASRVASSAFQSDDDFLRHLEEFQRRTDALQSQIAAMQSQNAAQLSSPLKL